MTEQDKDNQPRNLAEEMAKRRGKRYPAHEWIAEKFPDYVEVLVKLDEVIRLKPRRFDQKMHELFHILALAVEMYGGTDKQETGAPVPALENVLKQLEQAEAVLWEMSQ